MSSMTTTELELLIQKATSESIPNGELDLPSALEISDVIRSRRISPKDCMRCLKKRIMNTSSNPNTQLSSWKLTDVCIKNGGIPFIREICSREFMDTMEHTILKSNNNVELEELATRILYELYVAFKNDSQLSYVSRIYEKLLARGIVFPESGTSNSMAMFDSRTPADWVDSDACMICSKRFSILNRRHHCRSCGGIFCQDHSAHNIILSDLGIYEPVRVCDNCFEDYDVKLHNSSGKKRRHNSRKKKKGISDDTDEDEQLRRAIELSLKESKGSIEPIIPVMPRSREKLETSNNTSKDEDPDLKAAIEASIREAEEEKKRREASIQHGSIRPQQPQRQAMPSFELTSTEEEDIHLFASLVERMKSQSATEILENSQLQRLYQKILGTKPKVSNALNDTMQKYNLLIDMNTKISEIMNVYDQLLERQLKSISLSEQYSVPQVPSDPYAYYQKDVTASQQLPQNYQQSFLQPNSVHAQKPHLDQIRDLEMQPPVKQRYAADMPSEPPYPTAEDEDLSQEHTQQTEATESNDDTLKGVLSNESKRKLSNGAPYPVEDEESESASKLNDGITNFDFPTVPTRKVVQPMASPQPPAITNENPVEASESQEHLLIEL